LCWSRLLLREVDPGVFVEDEVGHGFGKGEFYHRETQRNYDVGIGWLQLSMVNSEFWEEGFE